MISTRRLRASMVGDRVVFDERGDPADVDLPEPGAGLAVLFVAPVTDAVKRVEAGRVESLDREEMWIVEAIALNRVVLDGLGEAEMTADELVAAVRELGYSWHVSPISSP